MRSTFPLFGLLGAGVGLAAGYVYLRRHENGHLLDAAPATEETEVTRPKRWFRRSADDAALPDTQETAEHTERRMDRVRHALLANPGPSRSRVIAGASGGALATWGAARGGLLGAAAGITGAALLSRIASRRG